MITKYLITGSNGLLGQKLVRLLSGQAGVEVVATSRGENRLPFNSSSYRYLTMDITNPAEVQSVISQERPDVVIHTAAMTQVDDCETNQELLHFTSKMKNFLKNHNGNLVLPSIKLL